MNRLANCDNRYQQLTEYKRVLCVCSAGLLRSPTAAVVLSQAPYNYNTRACGLSTEFALIPFDEVLANWADEIVCMEPSQQDKISDLCAAWGISRVITCLDIEDNYAYRDEKLMQLIKYKYELAHDTE